MASILRFVVVVLMFCVPFAFADVGPSPSPPQVTVHLVNAGAPETSISEITYHCMNTTDTDASSAVDPYPIRLSCSGGNCTNAGSWYYKFNPCFDFPDGYFSYDFGGKSVRSEQLNMSGGLKNYDITVDAPTGQISSRVGISCGMPGAMLSAILLGACALAYAGK